MKIILIANSGIGDAVHTFPLLKQLQKDNKDLEIHIITSAASEKAFDLLNIEYNNIPFNAKGGIQSLFQVMLLSIKLIWLRADYTFVSIDSMNNACALLAALSGAKKVIGQTNKDVRFTYLYKNPIPLVDKQHEAISNLQLLNAVDNKIDIQSQSEKDDFYQTLKEQYKNKKVTAETIIGVHPGAGPLQWKKWDEKKFIQLIERLAKDYKIFVFYGPNEQILNTEKYKNIINIVDKNLDEVCFEIGKCNLFVSNDTGLMHLSAAIGIKTIGIFGPTNPRWNSPYGKENIVIKSNLYCQPCYTKRGQKFHCVNKIYKKCLKDISVQQVYDICIQSINSLK